MHFEALKCIQYIPESVKEEDSHSKTYSPFDLLTSPNWK